MEPLMKISEFAYLSGIKRKNLIFYDEIGLLPPAQLGENGYRFYSYRQLETVSVIGALQELGVSLKEIKQYLDGRSPAALLELFAIQRANVEEKICRLQRIESMIDTRLDITRRALEVDPDRIELRECAAEPLFLGDEIFCQDTDEEIENALLEFYDLCSREKIPYGYPIGTVISRGNLLKGRWRIPSHFFYKIPGWKSGHPGNMKPAGLYLIGFEWCSFRGPCVVYGRMFDFMKKHGLAAAGSSYEEFLLDETSTKDTDSYLLQVSMQVEKQ